MPDAIRLAFTRAADFAIVKTSVTFLGFVLALVGALYVLRVSSSSYSLGVKASGKEANLSTTSPGLVMVTLGVVAVVSALFSKSDVNIDSSAIPIDSILALYKQRVRRLRKGRTQKRIEIKIRKIRVGRINL